MLPEGGADLGQGGAAIGLALPAEPLLMGAEVGHPRPYLGLEVVAEVDSRHLDRPRWLGHRCGEGEGGVGIRHRRGHENGRGGVKGGGGVGASSVLRVLTGSNPPDVATGLWAARVLPVTDCTNAIVCAFRRSRSRI